MSWLTQATLILDEADDQFYRRFLRSLTRQVQFLRSTAKDTPDGVPRLQAHIALTYAALCIAGQMRHLPKATRQLVADLERQILPDGGHASRNPGALIELLLDLLPLRQAFTARNIAPPAALINAIDRMMPMLRFFRHGDGTFGLVQRHGTDAARPARDADRVRRRARHAGRECSALRLPAHRSRQHRAADGYRPAAAASDELRSWRRLPVV